MAVTGGIILAASGLYWLGPAVALAVSAVVAYHATRLLRRVTGALRPTGPPHPVSEADRESLAQPPPKLADPPLAFGARMAALLQAGKNFRSDHLRGRTEGPFALRSFHLLPRRLLEAIVAVAFFA